MVDHSHLSNGNSSSESSSANLFVEFGVPLLNADLPIADVAMVESDPIPSGGNPLLASSSDSENSDSVAEASLAPEVQDIFKAAQCLTQKDRLEAVEERRKNSCLLEFISALGFSVQDVNSFVSTGTAPRLVDDNNIVVLNHGPSVLDISAPGVKTLNAHHMLAESSSRINPGSSLSDSGPVVGSLPSNVCPPFVSDPGPSQPQPVVAPPPSATPSSLTPPSSAVPPPSWSDVVAQSSVAPALSLEYLPPPSLPESGPILIRPPSDVLKEGNRRWNSCLVGGFSNARLPFKLVEANAHKLWDKFGLQKVFLQDKGFFVFKFSKPDDRDQVLASGPWYMANKLLVLKYWKEGIDFNSDLCTKIPVWVKLYNIPMSYWSAKGLSFLASALGKPLMADKLTEKLEPMSFARICIEIPSDSSFPAKLDVVVLDEDTNSEIISSVVVEYQNRPTVCPHCKSFGHSQIRCPRANYRWVPKASCGPSSVSQTPTPSIPTLVDSDPTLGFSSAVSPPIPTPHAVAASISAPVPDGWASTKLGSKLPSLPTDYLPAISNTFSPLITVDTVRDTSPELVSPNPLRDKLKLIDEFAVRELKAKGRKVDSPSQSSKKKSKNGGKGGGLPPANT